MNGGITTPEIAKELLEKTGVDGVGIGRGVMGKPWLLQQIKDYLETGSYHEPDWLAIRGIILQHTERIFTSKGNHGLLELRKHLGWYIKGHPHASAMRAQLVRTQSPDEIRSILQAIPA